MKKIMLAVLLAAIVSGVRTEEAAAEKAATTESKNTARPTAGAFIGITAGGDIEESDVAYGGQVQFPMSDTFFIELSAVAFSDSDENDFSELELDHQSIGLSVGAATKVANNCSIYGLFGPNYNLSDMEVDIDQVEAPGGSVDLDVEDSFGFHVAAGTTYQLSANVLLFIEYRYTFYDLDVDAKYVLVGGARTEENFEGSYDFGVAKVGLNYLF